MPGNISGCHALLGEEGRCPYQPVVETRAAAKYPTMHEAAPATVTPPKTSKR